MAQHWHDRFHITMSYLKDQTKVETKLADHAALHPSPPTAGAQRVRRGFGALSGQRGR